MATPYALIELEEIHSTQDEAVARARQSPVLVVAARQTDGRGRLGRRWETAPRAMAASLAIHPSGWRSAEFARLSLVAALAGQGVLGEGVACKWPNDLVVGSNKVAGLLLEARGDLVVIGLGVNLWWPEPPAGFGSLLTFDPGPEAGVDLAVRWCEDLLVRIERGPLRWGREDYVKVCRSMGREIRWLPEGSGVVRDVDEGGRLVVETESGVVRLSSGEVWEIR